MPFQGSVGPFWIAPDATFAVAAYSTGNGAPFTEIQDVCCVGLGIIPIGNPYDVTLVPTPAPSVTPTAEPSVLPVLSDVTSLSSIGSGQYGVGVIAGLGNGILAVNSLTYAPPQFGGFAPYQGATPGPGFVNRTNIAISSQTPPTTLLLRGPYDMLGYNTTQVATGYQFKQVSQNTKLGYGAGRTLRGLGGIAVNPADSSFGIVIQAPLLNNAASLSVCRAPSMSARF